jgi:uncharacterized iron-regulated membrane protein
MALFDPDQAGKTGGPGGFCMKFAQLNRVLHRWGAVAIAAPVLLTIVTGLFLVLKKEVAWIQPSSQIGTELQLSLSFDEILEIARTVPDAEISTWSDVDRLDVRPTKGMIKVRSQNSWEIQLDSETGEILQIAYRRSDFIESLHDGSFFHRFARLFVFFPSGLTLLFLWLTGIYLFLLPYLTRRKRRLKIKSS